MPSTPDKNAVQPHHCNQQKSRKNAYPARTIGYLSVAALFSAATLTFPFTVRAEQPSGNSPAAQSDSTASLTPSTDALASHESIEVSVIDGASPAQQVITRGKTVSDALQDAHVVLNNDDRVTPTLAAPLAPKSNIVVTRVKFANETETSSIPFKTVFTMSHDVSPGHIQAGHKGVSGELTKTYTVAYVNGQRKSRWLSSTKVTRPAVNQETVGGIRVREARALPSRGGIYQRMRCITMTATGYSPYEGSGSGRCATGMRAGYGVVAVDPRVIRLGTKLYIEGYGYAIAGDTGGAIKGRRVDLGHSTYREAFNVGRRRVQVWVLDSGR